MEKEAVRKQEQQRVDKVIAEIAHRESKLQSRSAKLKESVIDLRKNFWEDVTVNLDEPDDVIETQASIKQQAELLSERERSHGSIAAERNKLRRLKDSPYFARIDFKEAHEKEPEAIYIGTASLLDREEEDILIYDWRAPISSLYYDYALGEASYQTMEGSISGNISLKRQFIIRQGNIRGMFDTGITIGDRLLQEALGNNASATMKSIVATIQKEQNKIIRNEKSDLLVVQGVAGSGKTSAVLQRIAYLLYRHRQELNEKNMLLFSPNPLFSSYIANVLPELGEANISQATFLTFLKMRIGNKYTIETPFEQMEYALAAKESKDEAQTIRMSGMAFKSSLSFKKLIDAFAARLKDGGIFFRNIKLRGRLLISKEEISDYFYQLDAVIAIPNKLEMVAKWLVQKLRALQKEELHKDWVLDEMELMDKEDFLQAYYQNQAIDADDFSLEEKILRKEVVKRAFRPLIRQVKRFAFVHIGKTYQQLFLADAPLFGESVSGDLLPENWSSICRQTIKNLSEGYLTWEDATPFLYFKDLLFGPSADRAVRYLFIDEAQDYSAFQFAYIKHAFPYTKMTLLGDSNQAIYTYATVDNPLISQENWESHERITLRKSYRSTKQITLFTRDFAPGKEQIEPFEREGSKPRLVQFALKDSAADVLQKEIAKQFAKGNETVGVICKTMKESERVFEFLERNAEKRDAVKLITPKSSNFDKGLLVLPVYLAKGIEFDAVVIPDASSAVYQDEVDRNLFYTACTRAMHDLVMLSMEEPNRFIKEAAEDTYEVVSLIQRDK